MSHRSLSTHAGVHLAIWGEVDPPSGRLSMALGLPARTLAAAGLRVPRDQMLQLPVRGTLARPQVDWVGQALPHVANPCFSMHGGSAVLVVLLCGLQPGCAAAGPNAAAGRVWHAGPQPQVHATGKRCLTRYACRTAQMSAMLTIGNLCMLRGATMYCSWPCVACWCVRRVTGLPHGHTPAGVRLRGWALDLLGVAR